MSKDGMRIDDGHELAMLDVAIMTWEKEFGWLDEGVHPKLKFASHQRQLVSSAAPEAADCAPWRVQQSRG